MLHRQGRDSSQGGLTAPWTPRYPPLISRDPNTIFRGNSLTSKCIDETMKLAGMHYLHVTLKPTIEEVQGTPGGAREARGGGQEAEPEPPREPQPPRAPPSSSSQIHVPKGHHSTVTEGQARGKGHLPRAPFPLAGGQTALLLNLRSDALQRQLSFLT